MRVTGISIGPSIIQRLGLYDIMPKITVQTEAATEMSPGAIAEGNCDVVDDKVVVTDLEGRPIGKEELKPG